MDLKDIIAIAWKRRLTIVIVTVVAIVISAAIALTETNQYQSTVTQALTPNLSKDGGLVGSNDLPTLLPTYAAVVQAASTKDAAAKALGHPLDATISAGTTAGTGILSITATSTSPQHAAQAADAVSTAFVQSITNGNQLLTPQVISNAVVPTAPSSPDRKLIIALGVILGIALGFALALVIDRWLDRVSTAEEVTAATGLAALGHIPLNPALHGGGPNSLVWKDDADLFRMQEAFRALRTTLQLSIDSDTPVLQVTSPSPGDGKSTVAANLAIAIASVGIPVTLVDADFWAPRQHIIFGLSNARGLATMMTGDVEKAIPPMQRTDTRNLSVLTSGPPPDKPTELLAAKIEAAIARLRKVGRLFVIDSPPVLAVSDSRLIAAHVDSVVVVVSAGQRKSSALRFTIEQLQGSQSHIAGVVLNGVRRSPTEDVPAYGGYYRPPGTISFAAQSPPAARRE